MNTDVMIKLSIEGGPDLELTVEQARDLWNKLDTLFGGQQPYKPNWPIFPDSPYKITCSDFTRVLIDKEFQ